MLMRSLLTMAMLCGVAGPALAGPPVQAVAYRPDGMLVVAVDRKVIILDPATGKVLQRFAECPGPVTAIGISPDGKAIALAAGRPGQPGVVRVIRGEQVTDLPGGTDAQYGVGFAGPRVVAAGYDRLVRIIAPDTKAVQTGKDHSDAIYGLAVHPAGKLVATCAADRTVKVWDVETAKRIYTLSDATDWLYALAYSPDGKRVAAGGVDRAIRVWDVDEAGGKLVATFFAHDGAVLRLAFSPDGQSLYSLGEDRAVKRWDWARGAEKGAFARLTSDAAAMALSPTAKSLAVGRHDGTVTLHDTATGKLTKTITPAVEPPPKIVRVEPAGVIRGRAVTVTLHGQNLDTLNAIRATGEGVSARLGSGTPMARPVELTIPADMVPGLVTLSAEGPAGTATAEVAVDVFASREAGRDGLPEAVPDVTYLGKLARPGDVHTYRYVLKSKQEFGIVVTAGPGSKIEPALELSGPDGRVLAEGRASLAANAPADGTYTLQVRDRDYRGGPAFGYRLHAGAVPVLAGVFPLGVPAGSVTIVSLLGVHLPRTSREIDGKAEPGTKIPVTLPGVVGQAELIVGRFPEVSGPSETLPVPVTANGRIAAGAGNVWEFRAKGGVPLVIEAMARAHGSPLDPVIELLDGRGRPIEQARLRCVAKTTMVLRDISATSPALRLEAWNELAADDLLLIGREVIKIRALPGHPDADCDFYAVDGRRVAYFGTTPELHPIGATAYKVRVYPPGTELPANGFPVVPVYYRNDDGGAGYGKDARIMFTPPANGTFQVRVSDARGQSGELYSYRLTIRPAEPDFALRSTMNPKVVPGQATTLTVTAERRDGFEGPIAIRLEGVPAGFRCPPTTIGAGQNSGTLTLAANKDATEPPADTALRVVGTAKLGAERTAQVGPVKLAMPADMVTFVDQPDLAIAPGRAGELKMHIERRDGFRDRVPVEVRGLPHGAYVLNIGLNGIMITEKESARVIPIQVEPWVVPGDYPIAVVAKHEGKKTEHTAPPIVLRIPAPPTTSAGK